MTTETRQPDDAQWSTCPPGEIQGMVGRLQARQRRGRTQQIAAGAACFALLLVASFYAMPHLGRGESRYGGITCTELKQQAQQYLEKTLDAQMVSRIEDHLDGCKHCQDFIDDLQTGSNVNDPQPTQAVMVSHVAHDPPVVELASNSR